MLFKQISGQKQVKSRLLQAVKQKKVGHALLLAGPEGSGSLALAIAFARYLNCENRGEEDSCDACSTCRKYSRLIHPDLHLVFPVAETKKSGKKPVSDDYLQLWRESVLANPYMSLSQWHEAMGTENKQSFISRHESRNIIKKLSLKNFEAVYKVMIIWTADRMNIEAASTLLKILEEPPANTLFILLTGDVSQIVPTILSRAQLIKIPGIDQESMRHAVMEKGITGEGRIEEIVRQADGNYLNMLVATQETAETSFHTEMFISLMRLCFSVDIVGISAWIDKIADRGRETQKHFLKYALHMIRGNYILNIRAGNIDLLSGEEREFSSKFSSFIHGDNVFALSEELNKASLHIEYNGYSRLIFFDLALKIIKLLKI
jgi:DNA polymerase III subunit delta'